MEMLGRRYPKLRFFSIIMMISVLMVVSVAVMITMTTIKMSENFFIETYTVHNTRVMNQIKRNLESFHHSVVLTMDSMQRNTTIENTLMLEHSPRELMGQLFTLTRKIDQIKSIMSTYPVSISIIGRNQDFIYSTDSKHWPIGLDEIAARGFMEPSRSIQYRWDKRVSLTAEGEKNITPYVIITQSLVNRLSDVYYGTALIAIENSDFAELFNSHTREGNHMFIVDNSGTIISSDQEKLVGTTKPEFSSIIENREQEFYFEQLIDGREQIIMIEYLQNLDVYLFNMMDRNLVVEGVIDQSSIFLIVTTIVSLSLVVMFTVTKLITKRLSELTDEISKTSCLQFKEYVTVSGLYETREIAIAFNEMLDELHVYFDELIRTQQQKREAELTGLQRQINIHFLYNTLTSIKLLVQQERKEDATETIHDLISLLQFTVGDMNEMTNVVNEIASLESYVRINQKRYGNRIKVNFYATPEVQACQIPKLIIQPFIENAFAHAFQKRKEGNIDVFIWNEINELVCEVIDNGDGFEASSLSTKSVKNIDGHKASKQTYFSGVGIQNVRERIQLLYGTGYGVEVMSELEIGTTVTIRLPNKKG